MMNLKIGMDDMKNKKRTANSTYKKLAVHWLNKHLYFVSSSMLDTLDKECRPW